jgi:hypothetical protein
MAMLYSAPPAAPSHARSPASRAAAVLAFSRRRAVRGRSSGRLVALTMRVTGAVALFWLVLVALVYSQNPPAPTGAAQALAAGQTPEPYVPYLDCGAGCWNGIRLGETTPDEALAILLATPGVRDVLPTDGRLSWWWDGTQPAAFSVGGRSFDGRLLYAPDADGRARVTNIVIQATLLLGDVWLNAGEPSTTTVRYDDADVMRRAGVAQIARYPAFTVFTLMACPVETSAYWHAPVFLSIGEPDLSFMPDAFDLTASPATLFRPGSPVCA